ncbi:Zinc finger CCCH domain-containing protein 38 [Zea mays]|uniref:Zinc finger CCCH domain-containing protein 38 n=1 Tax=Zea mays TaxID=4577 RepID=A0A1D6J139_MAIZE|nr:Zinc finger CCCH domain-containing protein 38 [Zea mays]
MHCSSLFTCKIRLYAVCTI